MKTHLCKMALSKNRVNGSSHLMKRHRRSGLALGMGLLCISGFCFMCTSIMYGHGIFTFLNVVSFQGCPPKTKKKKKKKKKKYIFFLLLEI